MEQLALFSLSLGWTLNMHACTIFSIIFKYKMDCLLEDK